MIKINLIAEKKAVRAKAATRSSSSSVREGGGLGPNLLFVAIVALGAMVAVGWSISVNSEEREWRVKNEEADQELERLKEIRAKGEEFTAQKQLLENKIGLITQLKQRQAVPVHILDQLSRNLPDFLWLDNMTASNDQISVAGKATTYNAVSNFYENLAQSGQFSSVSLGRVFEVPEGVSFSLTCSFTGSAPDADATRS